MKFCGFLFLSGIFLFLLAEKINLATADLGRHLTNGEILISGKNWKELLTTNFYSYTQPDFSFINHHWGSGVIFFLIWKFFSFSGVHFFFLLIAFLTFGVFFYLAQKKADYFWASFFALLLMPLLAERREVRPEIFTCFFGGIFFLILYLSQKKDISWKWLFLLPIFQVIWVNLHIAFFLGILILGIFLVQVFWESFLKKNFLFFKKLLGITFLCGLATLINPNNFRGAIYPLKIFSNFGYELAENKSIFFLENYGMENPNFLLLKIILFFLVGSFFWIIWKKRSDFSWADLFLAGMFSLMALVALRNMSLAVFFLWPILASNFQKIFPSEIEIDPVVFLASSMGFFGIIFLMYQSFFNLNNTNHGIGLLEGINNSADFFKDQKISGPIFNNYDIGGYLIFHLKNQEKVFVDNRPEAYSEEFFQKTYIPMQEDFQKWEEIDNQYNFNSIFFYRHDLTPWGQKFLISLIDNPNWKPVFVDDFSIIFLKNNDRNKKIIDQFQLPKEIFGIK